MGSKQDLLFIGNPGDFEIILDGAKPVFCFQGLNGLGEDAWCGLLEVTKGRPMVVPIVGVPIVVVLGVGRKLLENSKVGLAFLASSFTLL